MFCLDIWWNWEGGAREGPSNALTTSFSSTLLLRVRCPSQTTVLSIKQPGTVPTYHSVADFCSLPAHRITHTSQLHPPMGDRGCLTFLIPPSLPPPAPGCPSVPEYNPCVAVACEVCIVLPVSRFNKLLWSHLFSVRCFWAIPITFYHQQGK